MRLLKRNYKKGFAMVVPKTLDDLWHLYNLIYKGDLVYSRTTREVKLDADYSRPQKGKRVSVFLGLRVEDVIWDSSLNRLRIRGKIHETPETVAGRGSHHTFNVTLNNPITIQKKKWLKHQIDRLNRALRSDTPPIIVVSIDSDEFCIAIIRDYGVNLKVESRAKLPGKIEAEKRSSAVEKYFKTALKALAEIWRANRFPIVIIGVGFMKSKFAEHLKTEAAEIAQSLVDVKGVNNGGIAGINEALRSGILDKALKHLRISEETRLVEELLARLGRNSGDATYGFNLARQAEGSGAVKILLVTDSMLRNALDETRLELEELMKGVESKGGRVVVVSGEHEAGEKLHALGEVAALLRYPIT